MKRGLLTLLAGAFGIAIYVAFLHAPLCVSAASHRIHFPSSVGACPPFVDVRLSELQALFEQQVASAATPEQIETELSQLGVEYSWNKYQSTYQGVLRHPESNFHAIAIRLLMGADQKVERIEIEDSFTAL